MNSKALYKAPSTPKILIISKIKSFSSYKWTGFPLNTTLIDSGTLNQLPPVIIPKEISVEPIPVENAPNAPCVQVCESAPIITSPGNTKPFSGKMHVQFPYLFIKEIFQIVFHCKISLKFF